MSKNAKDPREFTKAEYLELMKGKWKRQFPPKTVAIIGGGIAGLVSGWLLKQAGHEIKIFEASKTVGGRIKTLRDGFSGGLYAEAGAMRIPSNHFLTTHLIEEFGLDPHPFPRECDNSILFINNNRISLAEYKDDPNKLGFKLEGDERGHAAGDIYEHVVCDYVRGNVSLNWKDFDLEDLKEGRNENNSELRQKRLALFMDLDQYSARDFLKVQAKFCGRLLSPAAQDMISSVEMLEMQMPVSMAAILNDHIESNSDSVDLCSIVGGMDHLPLTFVGLSNAKNPIANDLRDDVNYSCRVTEIRAAETKDYPIFWENPITRKADSFACDFVIIAIPFSALRHVFMPALVSLEKMRAIRQLHYQNSCKVFIEFSKRFWTKEYPGTDTGAKRIDGGCSITDLPARQIFYPSEKFLTTQPEFRSRPAGVLLASYTWGDDSLRWTALERDDRIRFALRDIERVHNREEHGGGEKVLEEIFVGGLSHSWADDEFTSGAFAMFEPYQFRDLFKDIWKPEGGIHFCGEHTSMKHGWIEGAVESGIRAARDVYNTIEEKLEPNHGGS